MSDKHKTRKYSEMTKEDLSKLAREKNIPGRSGLGKDELIKALQEADMERSGKGVKKGHREAISGNEKREKLLDFLDKKAFDPIVKITPDDYKDKGKRKKAETVKEKTISTQRRYHENYTSAKDVKDNFEADLSSGAADKVHKDLKELGLPTLKDIKDDFIKLCNDLDVS